MVVDMQIASAGYTDIYGQALQGQQNAGEAAVASARQAYLCMHLSIARIRWIQRTI